MVREHGSVLRRNAPTMRWIGGRPRTMNTDAHDVRRGAALMTPWSPPSNLDGSCHGGSTESYQSGATEEHAVRASRRGGGGSSPTISKTVALRNAAHPGSPPSPPPPTPALSFCVCQSRSEHREVSVKNQLYILFDGEKRKSEHEFVLTPYAEWN